MQASEPGLAIHGLIALTWVACTPVWAWAGTLEGTATYRERIALPTDAVFEAVLQDISRADAPAEVLGRAAIDPARQPRLQRLPQPALIEPRLALTGMFTYMADAATITLCADGGRLPVAMEADYKALEAAYLKERRQPGQAQRVSLEGLIAPRPSMEAHQPPRLTLVVKSIGKVERYRISGSHLEMLDAAGMVIARFEAVALR